MEKISITGDAVLNDIYEKRKEPEDRFLYIAYAIEVTWENN